VRFVILKTVNISDVTLCSVVTLLLPDYTVFIIIIIIVIIIIIIINAHGFTQSQWYYNKTYFTNNISY
jgi:hypothetical protein